MEEQIKVNPELLCICEGKEVEEICLARRASGLCPQLPTVEYLKRQLEWLEEASGLKREDFPEEWPVCGDD